MDLGVLKRNFADEGQLTKPSDNSFFGQVTNVTQISAIIDANYFEVYQSSDESD